MLVDILPVKIILAVYLLIIINREWNTYQAIITHLLRIITSNIILYSILHNKSGSLGGKHQRPPGISSPQLPDHTWHSYQLSYDSQPHIAAALPGWRTVLIVCHHTQNTAQITGYYAGIVTRIPSYTVDGKFSHQIEHSHHPLPGHKHGRHHVLPVQHLLAVHGHISIVSPLSLHKSCKQQNLLFWKTCPRLL